MKSSVNCSTSARQSARTRVFVVGGADRRCADQILGRTDARMMQLHDRYAALGADGGGQPRQTRKMRIAEDAELARKSLALRLHMRGAGHGEAEAAFGAHGQPTELFVGEPSVLMALKIGERRQHETILHGGPAHEGQRLEQSRHGNYLNSDHGRLKRVEQRDQGVGWGLILALEQCEFSAISTVSASFWPVSPKGCSSRL